MVLSTPHAYFYVSYSLLALGLSLLSSVLPAYLVARRELREEAAHLLLPKPPVKGSKIFLERLSFIWRRLSFTQKVTARNIFRYKQRMFMTIFGVAGSVAVGKSTTARILQALLSRWPSTPKVQLVTTDGFLYPNAELQRRGIMHRKGFPESYDRRALLNFVSRVKSGAERVVAPKYSHLYYDIMPDEHIEVTAPDVLILEGLNVLAPSQAEGPETSDLTLSDFFDFSIYVDARTEDIERWYVNRFLTLRSSAFANPESYFKRYAELSDEQAVEVATGIWKSVNEPNLLQNILPTRARAHLILQKGAEHTVEQVLLRKN